MALRLWWLRGLVILLSFLYELPSITSNNSTTEEKSLDIKNDAASQLTKSLIDLYKNCSEMGAYVGVAVDEETKYEDDLCSSNFNYECLTVEKVIQKHLGKNVSLPIESTEGTCSSAMRDLKNEICYKKEEVPQEKPAYSDVWMYGFASVTVINICSLLGFFMFPFMGKKFFRHLLTTLTGLAASSLLGSALFHMIPQAYGLPETDEAYEYLTQSVYVGLGIWTFLLLERSLKIADDFWKRRQATQTLKTMESLEGLSTISSPTETVQPLNQLQAASQEQEELMQDRKIPEVNSTIFDYHYHQELKSQIIHANGHNHSETKEKKGVKTIVWMITFGDSLHNLIDGLSIGAAFSNSLLTGFSISLGVLCEEFPHELGDYAVLLNSGLTKMQAARYNFISSLSCYLGMVLGVILGEMQSKAIFAFAGGMFVYIALVDMIGEVNETIKQDSKISVAKALHTLLLQNLGMAAGGVALYLLAVYQDKLKFD